MARTVPYDVRIADMPAFKSLLDATVLLCRMLGVHAAELPDDVLAAADQLRKAIAEISGHDIGPPPGWTAT